MELLDEIVISCINRSGIFKQIASSRYIIRWEHYVYKGYQLIYYTDDYIRYENNDTFIYSFYPTTNRLYIKDFDGIKKPEELIENVPSDIKDFILFNLDLLKDRK